jgi:hypothetical protein
MSVKRTPKETCDLIFEKWKASLSEKDRSKPMLSANFDELFEKLKLEDIPYDMAHELVQRASIAHRPNKFIVGTAYKGVKAAGSAQSIEEFETDWRNLINDAATTSFHDFFKTELDEPDEQPLKERGQFGNMSEKEYKAQRKHADSYPTINTDELEKQFLERNKVDQSIDVEVILGEDSGEIADTETE